LSALTGQTKCKQTQLAGCKSTAGKSKILASRKSLLTFKTRN
jgi:hypothetical protein